MSTITDHPAHYNAGPVETIDKIKEALIAAGYPVPDAAPEPGPGGES